MLRHQYFGHDLFNETITWFCGGKVTPFAQLFPKIVTYMQRVTPTCVLPSLSFCHRGQQSCAVNWLAVFLFLLAQETWLPDSWFAKCAKRQSCMDLGIKIDWYGETHWLWPSIVGLCHSITDGGNCCFCELSLQCIKMQLKSMCVCLSIYLSIYLSINWRSNSLWIFTIWQKILTM